MRYRGLLVVMYVASTFAWYGVLRLEGVAGPIQWWGAPVWAVLLWFVFRGSGVAWLITLALTLFGALALVGWGPTVREALPSIFLVATQLTILVALRPHRRSHAY